MPNLLPNVDECEKFEIRAHSSLSKGQMHKIFFSSVGHGYKYENSTNTTQFYLLFHMNEQEWTELSKKIVRICRNQTQ